jgi:hypothetical protein
MMQVLVAQYGDRQKLYLSWDAASWHVSKKLFERIDEHNFIVGCKAQPSRQRRFRHELSSLT